VCPGNSGSRADPERISADNQAAATAEIVRANAQATCEFSQRNIERGQTQESKQCQCHCGSDSGTAEIVRANAQATLNSAGSTQNAALTQDAIRQTQMADLATTGAQAVVINKSKTILPPAPRRLLPIISPRKPGPPPRHPNGMPIRNASAKKKDRVRLLSLDVVPADVLCTVRGFGSLGILALAEDSASQPAYSRKSC
jgi:hypothetical protein